MLTERVGRRFGLPAEPVPGALTVGGIRDKAGFSDAKSGRVIVLPTERCDCRFSRQPTTAAALGRKLFSVELTAIGVTTSPMRLLPFRLRITRT